MKNLEGHGFTMPFVFVGEKTERLECLYMKISEWYPHKNSFERCLIYIRYFFDVRRMPLDEYLYYGYDYASHSIRKEMVLNEVLEQYEKYFNDNSYRDIFNEKKLFNKRFSKYIHRKILYLDECEYEEFRSFCFEQKRVIAKPSNLYGGKGIFIIDKASLPCEEQIVLLYQRLKKGKYIVEEYVKQADAYAEIYAESLNTIRVNTLIMENGKCEIVGAVNQFGSNHSITDNDEFNGIWAAIDLESGFVVNVEKESSEGKICIYHPDTKHRILGFRNEKWNEIKMFAKEVALVEPHCRLVGFDIAVCADGSLELIEGNVTPELGVLQALTKKGLKSLFEKAKGC